MDISTIKEGQVVKNYKELCALINIKSCAGKQKQLQMDNLSRYCDYHKEGNKIVIDKIFKKPKDKINTKQSQGIKSRINQGEYSKEMFPMVKNFVAINDNLEYITKGEILNELKLKNHNYDMARRYPKEVAELLSKELLLDISKEDIEIITYSIYENAINKIDSAFKNLEKMKYIYSYTNKLLTTIKDYKTDIPTIGQSEKIEKCIKLNMIKILKVYYKEKGYTNKLKELNEEIEYIKGLEDNIKEKEDFFKELKIQIFLTGLNDKLKQNVISTVKEISNIYPIEEIDNYFYSFGYIRNEDIQWDEEIISLAQQEIHLNNYKDKVKTTYLSATFSKHIAKKIKNNKRGFRTEKIIREEILSNLEEFSKKSYVLFELFTDINPLMVIHEYDFIKNSNCDIPF